MAADDAAGVVPAGETRAGRKPAEPAADADRSTSPPLASPDPEINRRLQKALSRTMHRSRPSLADLREYSSTNAVSSAGMVGSLWRMYNTANYSCPPAWGMRYTLAGSPKSGSVQFRRGASTRGWSPRHGSPSNSNGGHSVASANLGPAPPLALNNGSAARSDSPCGDPPPRSSGPDSVGGLSPLGRRRLLPASPKPSTGRLEVVVNACPSCCSTPPATVSPGRADQTAEFSGVKPRRTRGTPGAAGPSAQDPRRDGAVRAMHDTGRKHDAIGLDQAVRRTQHSERDAALEARAEDARLVVEAVRTLHVEDRGAGPAGVARDASVVGGQQGAGIREASSASVRSDPPDRAQHRAQHGMPEVVLEARFPPRGGSAARGAGDGVPQERAEGVRMLPGGQGGLSSTRNSTGVVTQPLRRLFVPPRREAQQWRPDAASSSSSSLASSASSREDHGTARSTQRG